MSQNSDQYLDQFSYLSEQTVYRSSRMFEMDLRLLNRTANLSLGQTCVIVRNSAPKMSFFSKSMLRNLLKQSFNKLPVFT